MAKKEFKAGAYAVISGVIVAVILVALTIFAFTTRYTAFKPEKVAQTYVDTIVQSGDGYNAYKNTLVSKNQKYGNFIINAYMLPYVNDGDDVKQADFVGTGNDDEAHAIDTVYETMYDYYVELVNQYGYDDYDSIYTNYFAKLSELRKEVYGDEYMDTDFMFGAFESNVSTYGNSLKGTEETLAADGKTVLQEASVGKYQEMFGEDYKLTAAVTECTALTEDEVKAYDAEYKERITPVAQSGEEKADAFGLADTEDSTPKSDMISAYEKLDCSDDITAVDKCTVQVTLADETVVATQELFVVQIGNSWYVDNTNIDTSALYLAK
ncbi:MAG: hypothetical protein PUE08_00485 [Eubacteriales bacterium]|nr:hypothetical protein [Eubacteriales bacterium]